MSETFPKYNMVDRKKMGKQNKEKGKRYERTVANKFSAAGFEARRSQQYKGTATSQDIEAETPVALSIECKYVQSLNIRKAYAKTVEDAAPKSCPTVVHGKAREIDLVTISLENFLGLLQIIADQQGKLHGIWEDDCGQDL